VGCSRKLSTGRSVIGEPGQSAFYANRFEGMVTLMPTRNVVLTDRQCVLINTLVESGRYQNASEVLREGLRLIEIREAENAARLHELRGAVQVGLDDLAERQVSRVRLHGSTSRTSDGGGGARAAPAQGLTCPQSRGEFA
jgi:antitoxin ParD1/3/4